MFNKLAKFLGFVGRHAVPATPRARLRAHEFDRRIRADSRAARPVLVCHWRQARSTGRLECRWDFERADAVAEERAPIGRGIDRERRDRAAWLLGSHRVLAAMK